MNVTFGGIVKNVRNATASFVTKIYRPLSATMLGSAKSLVVRILNSPKLTPSRIVANSITCGESDACALLKIPTMRSGVADSLHGTVANVGAGVGLRTTVGNGVGNRVGGEVVGNGVGNRVGGEVVGNGVGNRVGGKVVGNGVGNSVGSTVGDGEGICVGSGVGSNVGDGVGKTTVHSTGRPSKSKQEHRH